MKILLANDNRNAHYFERLGLSRALACAGHQVSFWDINGNKSSHDIFNELGQIDLFIGQSYSLNRAIIKCLLAQEKIKVILKFGDWGPFYDDKNLEWHQKYPILMATEEDKEKVRLLRDSGKLAFGFIHYHPDYVNMTHGYWTEKENIKVVSLMNGADLFEYTNGQYLDALSCDIGYLGGKWGYKSRTIDQWLLPLCNPNLNLNIKIFGNSNWGIPQYYGMLPTGQARNLFKSATICPNIHEPHSQEYGFDIVERPFKVMIAKGFLISDYVEGLRKLYSATELVMAKNATEFIDIIHFYLKNPEKRHAFINAGYQRTLLDHTYFDRAISIFENLNLNSQHIRDAKSQIMKELQ